MKQMNNDMFNPGRCLFDGVSRTSEFISHVLRAILTLIVVTRLPLVTSGAEPNGPRAHSVLLSRLQTAQTDAAARVDKWSAQTGHPARGIMPNGVPFEVIDIRNGRIWLYVTLNKNAAISTAADTLRQNLQLDGAGVKLGVWDAGAVRATHQEFGGRVAVYDQVALSGHGTHVAGTLIAAGVNSNAKGMAPSAAIDSYDWNSDTSEMLNRAATTSNSVNNLQLSNHSYGIAAGWFDDGADWYWYGVDGEEEDRAFGQYNSNSADMDHICVSAPYYMPVRAAGNDRDDGPPAEGTAYFYWEQTSPASGQWVADTYDATTDPVGDGQVSEGYDTLLPSATAKNILTVGSVTDAVSGDVRSVSAANMTSFSSWGPTDDGRIKPDLVANGYALYSPYSGYDSQYATLSGTSMASPNACGSAALLIQLHRDGFGYDMRASTLKALLLHTADDLSAAGPDYQTGWGLINVRAAGDILDAAIHQSSTVLIDVFTLESGTTQRYEMETSASGSVAATVCWTDPTGPTSTALDDATPKLVNDLDMRINSSTQTVGSPFILNPLSPADPATTGDNALDNVEQIRISGIDGPHRLTVSHKGTLDGDSQVASLVLSGVTSWRKIFRNLPEAIDQPDQDFLSSGAAPWFYQEAETVDGLDAAQSGNIGRNESSEFSTTVSGRVTVRFRWKVSSEANADLAHFKVNGSVLNSISGDTGWAVVEHDLGAGEHQLTWSYQKDNKKDQNADAAWVDNVEFIYPSKATVILVR